MRKLPISLMLLLAVFVSTAQTGVNSITIANAPTNSIINQNSQASSKYWTKVEESSVALVGERYVKASKYAVLKLKISQLQNDLVGVKHREVGSIGRDIVIELPHPNGGFARYQVFENSTMHPELAVKFPQIKSYDARGIDNPGEFVKFDITPQGFHAMIMTPSRGQIFIDPYSFGDKENYIVYYKKDFTTDKVMSCGVISNSSKSIDKNDKAFGTCQLRTYRTAVNATGEYTAFHGGSAAQGLAAIVTTMNRVNAIYERDMAITLTLVANNNLIVYTNGGSDPFTNGNSGAMIGESQTNCDAVIGNGNYDIGHIFGTNSGGLAGLGVVCINSSKGEGVTGSGSPVGDPFDIDYVAHEMGHQFGANHTFNNACGGSRNDPTAYEPGSGSSIMAYAGICPTNVQNNSDALFHGVSLAEIGAHITGAGSCGAITALTNNAPSVTGSNGNVTIPANTPFALTLNATDADAGDVLTYTWEQMDNQISTQPPVATATNGPNFRSLLPSTSPTRYFPSVAANV